MSQLLATFGVFLQTKDRPIERVVQVSEEGESITDIIDDTLGEVGP